MRKLLVTFAVLIFAVLFTADLPKAESSGQIAFLTVKVDPDGVTLLESRLVDGTVKERRAANRVTGLRYEMVSDQSQILSYDVIADPLIRHLEYEDPDQPGRLISKTIQLDEAVITIRVNYTDPTDRLKFYKVAQSADKRGLERESLGTISLKSIGKEAADE